MKKFLLVAALGLTLVFSANAGAYELQFRNGPIFGVSNWGDTQYKLGVNFAATSKGAESGFYSSSSIDVSVLQDTTIIWLQPEFQYDIKLGGLPLYIYPKIGLLIMFGWSPGDVKMAGFGMEFGGGVKFDLLESIYLWCEPFNMDLIFARYFWIDTTSIATGVGSGWVTDTGVAYELLFGVGFRL